MANGYWHMIQKPDRYICIFILIGLPYTEVSTCSVQTTPNQLNVVRPQIPIAGYWQWWSVAHHLLTRHETCHCLQ